MNYRGAFAFFALALASSMSFAEADTRSAGEAQRCSGICSIFASDAKQVIAQVNVTGKDEHDLEVHCAKAAGFFDHPWRVDAIACK